MTPRGYEQYVCEECLNDNYERCGRCGDYHHRDVMYYVEDLDEAYCDECLPEVAVCCDDCGEWHDAENMVPAHDRWGNEVMACDWCAEHHYTTCDECGELHPTRFMHTVGERTLCPDCYENREEGEAV